MVDKRKTTPAIQLTGEARKRQADILRRLQHERVTIDARQLLVLRVIVVVLAAIAISEACCMAALLV